MAKKSETVAETTETKTESSPVAASLVSPEPRNFLSTFLLAMFGGQFGLRHFYTGDKKLGWVRVGLFVGGYAWIFLMALMQQGVLSALGVIAIITAVVWAIVDFFYVFFSVRTDKEDQPLVTTARDMKWATVLFWVTVGTTALFIISGLAAGSWAENQLRELQKNNPGYNSLDSNQSPGLEGYRYRYDNSSGL